MVVVAVQRQLNSQLVEADDELLEVIQESGVVARSRLVNHVHGVVVEFFVEDVVLVVAHLDILGLGIGSEVEGIVVDISEAGGQVVHTVGTHAVLIADGGVTVHPVQQLGEGHDVLLDDHAGISSLLAVGEHRGQKVGDGVAFGGSPHDVQRHQDAAVIQGHVQSEIASFFSGDFLVANAGAGVFGAVSVQRPAVSLEDFDSLCRVVCVVVELLVEDFFGFLIHPLCGGVRTVDDRAVAAGEGGAELFAVKQVSDGLTDSSKLRGAKVALEHQLAVAVTGVVAVVEFAGLSHVEGSVDLVTVGQLGQEVDLAGLEGVHHGVVFSLDDNDRLNGGLYAFKVAVVVGVDLKGSGQSAGIEALDHVRASDNTAFVDVTGSVDAVSGQLAAVEVCAVAVVLDGQALTAVQRQVQRRQGGIAQSIVVVGIVGRDGDGVGIGIQQADTGQLLGLASLISFRADNGVSRNGRASFLGGRSVVNEGISGIVSSGDGLAVVVGQAFVDLDGEGEGAVVVLGLVDGGSRGLVHDHLTELIENDGVIVVDQVADGLVAGVVGPPCVAEVTGDFGGAAVDDLVLTGLDGSRIFSRGVVFGGSVGVFSGGVGVAGSGLSGLFGVVCAAGEHGSDHDDDEKQREELLQILFHLNPPVLIL